MATVKCALGKRGRPSHEWSEAILAEITGSSLSSICHSIARQRAGKKATGKTNFKYEEVWI